MVGKKEELAGICAWIWYVHITSSSDQALKAQQLLVLLKHKLYHDLVSMDMSSKCKCSNVRNY